MSMEELTIKDILPEFYANYNLSDDGGFSEDFVKIELNPHFYCYIPNWDNRRKAVLRHDIHHLVTGYKAILKGETEIASWELASDCSKYWAAYVLNAQGLALGVFAFPKLVYKAFIRGRHSENLYNSPHTEEELMKLTVNEIKDYLGLHKNDIYRASVSDKLAFVKTSLISILLTLCTIVLTPLILLFTIFIMVREAYAKTSNS